MNKPPFRFTQLLRDGSNVPIISFTQGYSLSKGNTVDVTRKDLVTAKAFYIPVSTLKNYPYVIGAVSEAGGQTFKAVIYRGYFDPNNIKGATVYQYHQEGNELIVDIDFHTNVTGVHMPVPAGWNGKTITVLDSDGSITVPNVVSGNGITVSVTGGYGSATLKIA